MAYIVRSFLEKKEQINSLEDKETLEAAQKKLKEDQAQLKKDQQT